jgi:hypothetical protein
MAIKIYTINGKIVGVVDHHPYLRWVIRSYGAMGAVMMEVMTHGCR